jgi:hypothetical protein
MGIAEFIIGPAEGRTRWLHPSYALIRRLVAGTDRAGVAQLAPMRRESRGDCVSVADRCAGD